MIKIAVFISLLVQLIFAQANSSETPEFLAKKQNKKIKLDTTSKDADLVAKARAAHKKANKEKTISLIKNVEACAKEKDRLDAELCRKNFLENTK